MAFSSFRQFVRFSNLVENLIFTQAKIFTSKILLVFVTGLSSRCQKEKTYTTEYSYCQRI